MKIGSKLRTAPVNNPYYKQAQGEREYKDINALLNEMTKEELINCMINNYLIFRDYSLLTARGYLIDALLTRMRKVNSIKSKVGAAKTRKELIEAIEEDEKRHKKWEKINKRIDELQKEYDFEQETDE